MPLDSRLRGNDGRVNSMSCAKMTGALNPTLYAETKARIDPTLCAKMTARVEPQLCAEIKARVYRPAMKLSTISSASESVY